MALVMHALRLDLAAHMRITRIHTHCIYTCCICLNTIESTPAKIYNANVSCATLLSFVKSACIRDIEDYCKHKNIQLGIELDAVRKVIQQQQARHGLASAGAANSSNGALSTTRSTASLSVGAAPSASGSRPPSGASKSRPATPGTTRSVMASRDDANSGEEDASDEFAEALAQKELLEKQLDVVNTAAKYAKGRST
jgi:hypothetical protein